MFNRLAYKASFQLVSTYENRGISKKLRYFSATLDHSFIHICFIKNQWVLHFRGLIDKKLLYRKFLYLIQSCTINWEGAQREREGLFMLIFKIVLA